MLYMCILWDKKWCRCVEHLAEVDLPVRNIQANSELGINGVLLPSPLAAPGMNIPVHVTQNRHRHIHSYSFIFIHISPHCTTDAVVSSPQLLPWLQHPRSQSSFPIIYIQLPRCNSSGVHGLTVGWLRKHCKHFCTLPYSRPNGNLPVAMTAQATSSKPKLWLNKTILFLVLDNLLKVCIHIGAQLLALWSTRLHSWYNIP